MDYASLLFDPIYNILGVPATITLDDTAGTEITLTAIDKTSGVAVGHNVEVQTVEPAAVVRCSELDGIAFSELEGATITLNNKTWEIRNHQPKPSPKGEADGEVYLLLTEV